MTCSVVFFFKFFQPFFYILFRSNRKSVPKKLTSFFFKQRFFTRCFDGFINVFHTIFECLKIKRKVAMISARITKKTKNSYETIRNSFKSKILCDGN